ncbi:MAG: hypothetical protein J0L84_20005 [Verrucomicrobia bacterium]|nr:hypothetical protein [Verrucomicrobiota bacterium]
MDRRSAGQTLGEVLAVIVALVVLFFMIMTPVSRASGKPKRLACVNNLKNIGLGLRVFADRHAGEFPMNVPASQGGTRELTEDASRLWQQFLVLSNDLASPARLVCPSDVRRTRAGRFPTSPTNAARGVVFGGNQNLSYFLGLNASDEFPDSILSGDRNITNRTGLLSPGRHVLAAGAPLGFNDDLHGNAGNILLADGSVQQVTSGRLRELFRDALTNSGLATNGWLVP